MAVCPDLKSHLSGVVPSLLVGPRSLQGYGSHAVSNRPSQCCDGQTQSEALLKNLAGRLNSRYRRKAAQLGTSVEIFDFKLATRGAEFSRHRGPGFDNQ